MKKRIVAAVAAAMLVMGGVAACSSPADTASHNLSAQADNFQIPRRIVFFNGITDTYLLEIIGYCSLGNDDPSYIRTVTCKVNGGYEKHFVGLSDNVSYFVQQMAPADVSTNHSIIYIRPQTLVPSIQNP